MTDAERAMVLAMLIAAGHTRKNAEWMAASCPDMKKAWELVAQDKRRELRPIAIPESAREVGRRYAEMKLAMGTERELDAVQSLHRAIDAHYAKAA